MSGIRLEQSQDIDEILLDCKLASVLNIHQGNIYLMLS